MIAAFSFLLACVLWSASARAVPAQPVPVAGEENTNPQIEISGIVVGTAVGERSGASGKTESSIDFSDSALLIGAAQRLQDRSVGSAGLGWLTLDDTNRGNSAQLFLNQAFVDYQSERFEFLLGRSESPTAHLIDFPTIRGDDLIEWTNPLNPYSDGGNSEEHRYGNVVSGTWNQGLSSFVNFHVQHQISSAHPSADTGINSFGASFQHLSSPGFEVFSRVPEWGLGFERFTRGHQLAYAGAVLNLTESVVNRWDLRFQNLYSFGNDARRFSSVTDTFAADSNAIAASLRYHHSPFGAPGTQIALTGGYKTYAKVDDASSYGFALTGVRQLGKGFDLVAQYEAHRRADGLATFQSDGRRFEHALEVGFLFSFDATLNQNLTPRRTNLNQRHGHLPTPVVEGATSQMPKIAPTRVFQVKSDEEGESLRGRRGFGEEESSVEMMNLMMTEGSGYEGMEMSAPKGRSSPSQSHSH